MFKLVKAYLIIQVFSAAIFIAVHTVLSLIQPTLNFVPSSIELPSQRYVELWETWVHVALIPSEPRDPLSRFPGKNKNDGWKIIF